MTARSRSPQFPIAEVLEALGFENVPRVTHGYRKLCCAFHGDRSPSASVSRYGFTCFACGRRGDAIKLLREEEGLSFEDAVRRATAITGIEDQSMQRGTGWGDQLLE